jgi:hypothetical protein
MEPGLPARKITLYPFWEHDTVSPVRIIARNTFTRFVAKLEGHKDRRALKAALDAWYREAHQAE